MTATGSISYTTTVGGVISSHIVGIYGRGSSTWTTNSNEIGGISASNSSTGNTEIHGLRGNGTGNWICTNNTIGGDIVNSVNNSSPASQSELFGIFNTGYTGTFTGNVIRNLSAAGGWTAATLSVAGINMADSIGTSDHQLKT